MAKPRFKIDVYDYSPRPFGLYFAQGGTLSWRWRMIEAYATKEEAKAMYDKIKDLPEYLP